MQQLSMFDQGEDLPLFSGTATRAEPSPFQPKPQPKQETMANCRFCLDTGRVQSGHKYPAGSPCWCEAGQKFAGERLVLDCASISSGTLAND